MTKWLRRKRNSLGYGIQSPSDFFFVQHVLREESPYYAYATLGKMEKTYNTCIPCYPEATNRLLFRLANHVHPETIVEVGASLSIFAMAMACPSAWSIAITPSHTVACAMQPLLKEHPQIKLKKADEMAFFNQNIQDRGAIGLLHIAHTSFYREIVEAALPYTTDHTLFIIEGIRDDKEKQNWWKELQEDSLTGISYDLGSIGLLFFDRSRHKETYWINLKD